MDLGLTGKRAVVSGGSRGIGRAIARQLALEGVDVSIAARTREALEATARELAEETGRKIVPIVADVSDDSSVEAMVATAADMLGGIDILINNAAVPGGRKVAAIEEMDVRHLLDDIDIKIGGYLRAARAASPYMVEAGWGRIISIGGLGARLSGNYSAAIRTAGVSALTKNLADELGLKGVCAMAIHPGVMPTDAMPADVQQRLAAATSSGRLFDPSTIAWLATMLASPSSTALNGQTIQAGGGIKGIIEY
ncbi:SDR family NAD(P)-dependent oxidoreductase [Streptomyces sp. NPDC090499]|uniref:SDR family NAD(P)-dependent oxidoreductase n=1 Tax=Streptomyces sp. NPDC090499 TaxID=3365965 RepID=UPI00380B7485